MKQDNTKEYLNKENEMNLQAFDIDEEIKESMKNEEFKKYYEEKEEEFALLDAMLEAQRISGLSQTEIAQRMNKKQPSISRMLKGKHQPTAKMVIDFIHANNMRIKHIELEPIEAEEISNEEELLEM